MGAYHLYVEIIILLISYIMILTVFYWLIDYHHLRMGKDMAGIYQRIYAELPIFRCHNLLIEGSVLMTGIIIAFINTCVICCGGDGIIVIVCLLASVILLVATDRHLESVKAQYILSMVAHGRESAEQENI